MKIKIGNIEITEIATGGFTQYQFTRVVGPVYSPLGAFATLKDGLKELNENKYRLAEDDLASLEKLSGLIEEHDGDMKEVRKALIDLE